jgi:hypothetical protein
MNELAKSIAELIGSINSGANQTGEAIRKIAPYAWRCAVYEAKLDAWTTLACVLGIAVMVFVGGLKFHQMQLNSDSHEDQVDFAIYKWVALSIAALITILGICSNLDEILNPEYEAASQLSTRFLGK